MPLNLTQILTQFNYAEILTIPHGKEIMNLITDCTIFFFVYLTRIFLVKTF